MYLRSLVIAKRYSFTHSLTKYAMQLVSQYLHSIDYLQRITQDPDAESSGVCNALGDDNFSFSVS